MKMPRPMTRLRSPSPSEAAPKSGASGAHHLVVELLGVDEVGVGVVAAEVGQGGAVADGARRRAEAVLEDLGGVGAGDGGHGVEGHAEAAGEHGADGGEVEERLHQLGVVGDGVDDLDGHVAELLGADLVEVEVGGVEDLVLVDLLGALVDRLGDPLGGGAAVADVVLDAEVFLRAAGVVAGGEDDAAVGAVLADDVGGGGGGEDAALPDQHPAEAVGGGHLQRDLDDLAVEVAAVAADHQRLAGEVLQAVEDRLDEVLHVVRLLEVRNLLAQAGGAGLLVVVGLWSDTCRSCWSLPAGGRRRGRRRRRRCGPRRRPPSCPGAGARSRRRGRA